MSNTEYKEASANTVTESDGEFKVLEEPLRPPVNEFKRFVRVFFRRKIVIVGFVLVVINILMAIFANVLSPYDPYAQDYYNVLAAPSAQHILGTDALGRDVLSRVLYGSRVAISVGVISVVVSAAIGTLIGLVAGYAEGWVQALIMRITDALMAIPSLILQLLVAAVLNRGVAGVVIAVSVTLFPGYIRLVCGQVMSLKQNDYIMAERSMGAKTKRVLFKHLLPNCVSPLIVQMTMMMGVAILSEASLSFLNLGILPPTAAWGGMCYDGYKYLLTRPLLSIVPGLAIMILVFSFNMVGDGLRDALDPKMRGSLD